MSTLDTPSHQLSPASSSNRGRPTKLTPRIHTEIVKLVRQGVPVEIAAGACGISHQSFYNWMNWGEDHYKKSHPSIYLDFFESITLARQELESELVAKWRKLVTEGTERIVRVYKEKVVEKSDGTIELVKYLASETIDVTGDGDWRGIAEMLLRRWPERWSRKEGVELTGKDGGPVQIETSPINMSSLSPQDRKEILAILERAKALKIEEGRKEESDTIDADYKLIETREEGTGGEGIEYPPSPSYSFSSPLPTTFDPESED